MNFSVLLPTRNRLDLLRYAIETVRRQDHPDWEIVVSDNCSEEDVSGYVRSLGDPRIRYVRTERFVPVTENWNNALAHSTGEYVVMLGDDDGLMPGYFSRLRAEIERRGAPDFVYTSALLYAYPNVMPGLPDGLLRTYDNADFLQSALEPFWLARDAAHRLVHESMRFRVRFGYNMQFALVSRRLVERLREKGDFYQSPYPDYYAMNAMMLVADRILVVPERLVAIGISPKSFGYYYFNEREQSGVDFLKNLPDEAIARRVRSVVLPGSNMNTSWLIAMETLLVNFAGDLALAVQYGSYRTLQIVQELRRRALVPPAQRGDPQPFLAMLSRRERALYWALAAFAALCRLVPPPLRPRAAQLPLLALGTYPRFDLRRVPGSFSNMLDVFNHFQHTAGIRPEELR